VNLLVVGHISPLWSPRTFCLDFEKELCGFRVNLHHNCCVAQLTHTERADTQRTHRQREWRHRIQMNEVLVCYLLLEFGEYSTGPQGVCFSHFGVLEAILKFEVGF
jgi:hypothetical protein